MTNDRRPIHKGLKENTALDPLFTPRHTSFCQFVNLSNNGKFSLFKKRIPQV